MRLLKKMTQMMRIKNKTLTGEFMKKMMSKYRVELLTLLELEAMLGEVHRLQRKLKEQF